MILLFALVACFDRLDASAHPPPLPDRVDTGADTGS
jgi:hypothetical protein